jgi:hypothetical protein
MVIIKEKKIYIYIIKKTRTQLRLNFVHIIMLLDFQLKIIFISLIEKTLFLE